MASSLGRDGPSPTTTTTHHTERDGLLRSAVLVYRNHSSSSSPPTTAATSSSSSSSTARGLTNSPVKKSTTTTASSLMSYHHHSTDSDVIRARYGCNQPPAFGAATSSIGGSSAAVAAVFNASTSADLLEYVWSPASWMGDLQSVLARRRLCHLRMVGSHDSATYGIGPNSDFAPDAPGLLKSTRQGCLSSLIKTIAKPITRGWARCQNLTVLQQLELGVRYLDLRVAWTGTEFHVTHSLLSVPLQSIVTDMLSFYQAAGRSMQEIVIMDLQHIYGVDFDSAESCGRLFHQLAPLESLFIAPPLGPGSTLGDIWATRGRILLCVGADLAGAPSYAFKRSQTLRSPWLNRNNAHRLLDALLGEWGQDAEAHHQQQQRRNGAAPSEEEGERFLTQQREDSDRVGDGVVPPTTTTIARSESSVYSPRSPSSAGGRLLYVTQAVMTPLTKDIAQGILSCLRRTPTTIRDYACQLNGRALRWFRDLNLRPDIRSALLRGAANDGLPCFREEHDDDDDDGSRPLFNTHGNVLMLDYVEEGLCEWDLGQVHGSPIARTQKGFPSSSSGYHPSVSFLATTSSEEERARLNGEGIVVVREAVDYDVPPPSRTPSSSSSSGLLPRGSTAPPTTVHTPFPTASLWMADPTTTEEKGSDHQEHVSTTIQVNAVQLCVFINLTIAKVAASAGAASSSSGSAVS